MTGWLFLAGAIIAEVCATLCLRASINGPRIWYVAVGCGYVLAFFLLSRSLAQGVALGVAYGIWAAAGVAMTVIACRVLFGEPITRLMAFGFLLVVAGIFLIEAGSEPN